MTSIWKDYLLKNINKIFIFIFTIIFGVSISVYKEMASLTIVIITALVILNVVNIFSQKLFNNKNTSKFIEITIYEIIAVLGISFISLFYVLVFVLIVETLRNIANKALVAVAISANSIIYLAVAFYNVQNGVSIWQAGLLLFLSVALSIYFINSDSFNNNSNSEIILEKENIEKKYLELMQEHENVLMLKKIMDISNDASDINKMIVKINELIFNSFRDIDYSTMLLYDDGRNEFKIATTNLPNQFHKEICKLDQFDIFEDVIVNTHGKALSSEIGLNYPTAGSRHIRAALCLPLHTNKSLIGIMLFEAQDSDTFKNVDLNQFNLIRYYISLIIENKKWIKKIEKMALQDGLTGVYNRNYLYDFLQEQMKSHRENNREFCLTIYDIDHFKKFNDTYGHLFGDLVLKELSNLVKNSIRDDDVIARYGGEEFIIVLVNTSVTQAKQRIEEIRQKIERLIVRNEVGIEANVTASFGIAEFGEFSYNVDIQQLIERADKALYQSKDNGRNRVTVYNPEMR